MKCVIFFSNLQLWSIGDTKGAPSFHNTVKAYVDAGYRTILVNPDIEAPLLGVEHHSIKIQYVDWFKKRKLGFIAKVLSHWCATKNFIKTGEAILNNIASKEVILYAYEVGAVRATKALSLKHSLPIVTRFQGTILLKRKRTLINRVRFYPHFQALGTGADIVVMTNDGSFGDIALKNALNPTNNILFLRNGVNDPPPLDTNIREEILNKLDLVSGEKILVTLCRLVTWKRVDRTIHLLKDLTTRGIPCKFICVGEGEEKENLITLTGKLGLTGKVVFVGQVPRNEIYYYIDIADVFLSLNDLSNMGNPLFEALAAGKPIITLDSGDTSSVIMHNENGVLLSESELYKAADYAIKIFSDQEYRNKLAVNGKQWTKINMMTWDERMATEIFEVENSMGEIGNSTKSEEITHQV